MKKNKIRKGAEMHEIEVVYKRPVFDEMPKIRSSKDVYKIVKETLLNVCLDYQEHVWCFYMNNANRVLGFIEISTGDATGTIVNIPKIFAVAINVSAKAIIMVHNHPSGTLKPSEADKKISSKVSAIGELFSIGLLDNLIITTESYYSFSDEGIILTNNNTLPF